MSDIFIEDGKIMDDLFKIIWVSLKILIKKVIN